jgi:hypothetical protein
MVLVRARLLLIALSLVILAFVGLRHVSQNLPSPHASHETAGQLAGQPAPEPTVPAIVKAPATVSSTVQMLLDSGGHRVARPALDVMPVAARSLGGPDTSARPRSFPLLI